MCKENVQEVTKCKKSRNLTRRIAMTDYNFVPVTQMFFANLDFVKNMTVLVNETSKQPRYMILGQ